MQLLHLGTHERACGAQQSREVESLWCGDDRVDRRGRMAGKSAAAGLSIRDKPVALRASSGLRVSDGVYLLCSEVDAVFRRSAVALL
jgi:hypothetical protein